MPMRTRFVSLHTLATALVICLPLAGERPAFARPAAERAAEQQSSPLPAVANPRADPQAWFAKGQAALQNGDLDVAEAAFRRVLAVDPRAGSAYANLGVVAMRRKDWDHAIELLHRAEKLEPKMAGVRLNIGLVEYRRGNYAAAIAPLASVVRDQPDSQQARYLLGLCQVFTKHYAEAVTTLEPLWAEKSNEVLYLYLLDIAAQESGQKELDEKILNRMTTVGQEIAEFHLILGKAHLNREETEPAITELERAVALNPNLPFVHFNLGMAYGRSGDYERAESEFRRDIALEPDLADNYEQLGALYSRMGRDDDAERTFHEAVRRDSKMASAYAGLAKLYQKQQKFAPALKMADETLRISPDYEGGHYLRGRILMQLGREKEARVELAAAQKVLDSRLQTAREKKREDRVPNPELTREPEP
jgi:tetratricopeptide (TPR) repeat protein